MKTTPITIAIDAIVKQASSLATMAKVISKNPARYNAILETLRRPGLSNYESRVIITGVGKNANIATKASETFCFIGYS
ncbi:hypothetical protein [Escherichia phage OLB35]|uniref:Uncharacterized protein n=1 Tax=Escherichia phage OLB35 TaxID=2448911 RepID=A0A3G3MBV3_9CAUD|nr:hypothetical protein [Escherichia phage OLB35]